MANPNPYEILGVSPTATQDEIKNAYRRLAKEHHPDLNPGDKRAENKFKELSHAYERIGTPEARAKHDRGEQEEAAGKQRGPFYHQTQEGGPEAGGRYTFSFGGGEGRSFDEDLFESLFRGAGTRGARAEPPPALYRLDIDLRDAILGAQKEIVLPTGKRLSVRIPPGVSEGTRLRFGGEGEFYVELHLRPDPRFQIQGNDLITELPVLFTDAWFGGHVRAPTVENEVSLKIPARSSSGTKLKLAGKGLYDRATQKRGDLIAVVRVALPGEMDAELEQALRAWQARRARVEKGQGAA